MTHGHNTALAIDAKGLVKVFGSTRAVDGVDLQVPKGMVYGVLGPNGAGKTTTIRLLATLLTPESGTATVFGHDIRTDPDAVRSRVSLTGQFASVDEDLSGTENLVMLARLLGFDKPAARQRAAELLAAFDLTEAADRQVKTFSGGMRRRIDIAASIVVTPDLIFLDEPTTGLDPRSRNQVWDIIRALVAAGTTALLTTQYLDEADKLADRIAVIDRGKVIAEGTPAQLKASVGSGTLRLRVQETADLAAAAQVLQNALGGEIEYDTDPTSLLVRLPAEIVADQAAARVTAALGQVAAAGIPIADFALGQPSLDEVFMALTGHPAEDEEEAPPAGAKDKKNRKKKEASV